MTISTWFQVLFVLALFAGATGYGYWEFYLRPKPVFEDPLVEDIVLSGGGEGSGRSVRSHSLNFRYDLPAEPWEADEEIKKVVPGAVFGMRRGDEALVVWAKDFRTHTPRNSVIVDDALTRLGRAFANLQSQQQPDTEVAGRPAMYLTFQGERPLGTRIAGDCYLFAQHGIAYGLIAWAAQPAEHAALWQRFALLDKRDDWAEERAKAQVLHGNRLAYTLQDPFKVWTRDSDIQTHTGADLALMALDPVAERYRSNAATVIVLLPPARGTLDDAITAARQHLEQAHRKDAPDARIDLLPGQDVRLDLGGLRGLLSKFHVIIGDSNQRFAVQAVFHRPGTTVVVQCECPWRRRQYWERDFDEIVRTFRLE
jgi:hypothetical protein